MNKIFITSLISFINIGIYAQVGINTPNPDPSSILDVKSTDKGVLLPRVTITTLTQQLSPNAPNAISLLVYNLGSSAIPKGYYSWDGDKWTQFMDSATYEETSFWKAQSTPVVPKTDNKSDLTELTTITPAVNVNIYQKGKVGIGYSDQFDIDFNTKGSPKQLEIGGDFRTSYYDSVGKYYYGIETNSKALPSIFQQRGNIFYNSLSKDLEDYSFFNRAYDGSMIIQSQAKILQLSRTGKSTDPAGSQAHETEFDSSGLTEFIYTVNPNSNLDKQVVKSFTTSEYSVFDSYNDTAQFGLNFDKGNFFLGSPTVSGYYFPNTRPLTTDSTPLEKDNQILKYNTTTKSLEWTDNNASPKFFYMPSVVLPTLSTDALIGTGTGANYTYDPGTLTYSVNLYELFKKQFSTPIKSSKANANLTEFVLTSNLYDYFVTYADDKVFDVSTINLSATGILTYKVNANAVIKTGSFMNIVLKVNN